MIRASVFVGVSVDGFLARKDHALDFLPDVVEDHGYTEFMASVDALVIGRNTYEVVRAFPDWPYGEKPVFVLTTRPLDDRRVARLDGEPGAILAGLEARGMRHVYVDGGDTIQRFLRAGAIDRMTVTRVPVLIGEGIPLFGPLAADVKLRHEGTRTFPSGLVQSVYVLDSPA